MANFYASYPFERGGGGGVQIYATFSDFPPGAETGDLAVAADTGILYEWNGSAWVPIASPGSVFAVGPFGSTPNADGASITSNILTLQPADNTHPGGVSITTQTFAGNKTFTGSISASNLSGTNTGDVTIGAANGLSLAGQALSLALSSTSTTGALSSTDWNTFNGKQAAGNYITALTGDGTASGPGSAALTLATVNTNVGTFAAVTVNGKGLVTAASALSGDATTSGSAITLSTVNSNVGSFGSAAAVGTFTVNSKGLVTAASSTSIQIAESQVTNLVSDLAGKQAVGNYATSGSGDVSWSAPSGAGPVTTSIGAGVVTLSQMANLAANSIIGNNTGSSATPIALTVSQVNTLLGTLSNPMTTAGDMIYGGSSGTPTRLVAGSSGQVPISTGSTVAFGSLQGNSTALKAPTIQKFTTTGTTTGYLFTVSSANATVGATYTNNGNTYTVLATIAAGTQLFVSGASAPTSSGTLTKASGTGDATITFSSAQALATYTTPTSPSPLYIRVRAVGGGGGGAGGGSGAGFGGNGSASIFGASLLSAGGGLAPVGNQANPGQSGASSLGSGPIGIALSGGGGSPGTTDSGALSSGLSAGSGGNSAFGGGGSGGNNNAGLTSGQAGSTNTGGGGGGGYVNGAGVSGGGGGSGGFVDVIITSPAASYPYAVGPGGTAGGAGSSSGAAGAGAAGLIEVTEYYQ